HAAGRPFDEPVAVVHPGVVAAQRAPPDEDEAVRLLGKAGLEAAQVLEEDPRGELDPLVARTEPPRKLRPERPQIDPVGFLRELAEREPVRTEAQHQIEQAPRSDEPARPQRHPECASTPASPMAAHRY